MYPQAKEGQGLAAMSKARASQSLQRECCPTHLDPGFWLQNWSNGFLVFKAAWHVVPGFSGLQIRRPPWSWVLGRSCPWGKRSLLQRRA